MDEEHPIKRKIREAREAAAAKEELEGAEALRNQDLESYARFEWPVTMARLVEEIERANSVLAEIPLNQRYFLHHQPQPGQGNAGRGSVSLTDNNTAATVYVEIAARLDGEVVVRYSAVHKFDNFPLAAGSNSKWEAVLAELHDHLPS